MSKRKKTAIVYKEADKTCSNCGTTYRGNHTKRFCDIIKKKKGLL